MDPGRKTRGHARERVAPTATEPRRVRWRRRILGWTSAAVAVAVAMAGTVALLHRGQPAATATPAALGPEGMPLQQGTPLAPASEGAGGGTVDGIRCEATEHVAYHIHAHLAVFVGGVPRPIPYGIGLVDPAVAETPDSPFATATRCYYWLHTHTTDGIIHVESPTRRQYTLGDFFDIWRQPLSTTRVGPATGAVTTYVDGRPYSGDPRGIVLREQEDIQLDVGFPRVPPQPVDWSRSDL